MACGLRSRARRARLDVGLAGLNRTDREAEYDRSWCGAWWACLVGVVVCGVAHGRAGSLRGGGLVFVGITGFSGECHVWWLGSHVR